MRITRNAVPLLAWPGFFKMTVLCIRMTTGPPPFPSSAVKLIALPLPVPWHHHILSRACFHLHVSMTNQKCSGNFDNSIFCLFILFSGSVLLSGSHARLRVVDGSVHCAVRRLTSISCVPCSRLLVSTGHHGQLRWWSLCRAWRVEVIPKGEVGLQEERGRRTVLGEVGYRVIGHFLWNQNTRQRLLKSIKYSWWMPLWVLYLG